MVSKRGASILPAPSRHHSYTDAELKEIGEYQELKDGFLIPMQPNENGTYTSGEDGIPWWKNKQYYNPETLSTKIGRIPTRCFLGRKVIMWLNHNPQDYV
jgi:hypothetical protein